MKKQIQLSSRSQVRPGNGRSIICEGSAWPGLLLAGYCAMLSGLAYPAQAAVIEAWVQRYNGPANLQDYATAVAVDAGGNVVVTGNSVSANIEEYGLTLISDYYTAKYSAADGALLWERRYNGPADHDDVARAVAVDGSGNVLVTGSSIGSSSDYYTAKYAAADGALLWEKRYNGPVNYVEEAKAVAVDGSGNVVVTGYSYNTNYNADYYTAKYAAADGALLWEKRYNGPANSSDYASAVAVDSSGNVVVTGSSYNGGPDYDYDYYTAKYAAANGALLWEKRYNGPAANGYNQAQAVAVDGSGNVVVTGYSLNGTYNDYRGFDYYTAKYAAADGALLWEQRYNGPANGYDVASALAVDGSGNVVVTGSSYNGTNGDYYTVKYAAAGGALLWEQRYNSPANSDDLASAVAVDGSGNVVVTGSSYNGTNSDYYAAKYAAANGALLWEKRSNGPKYVGGYGSTLALGPNGMVAITGSSVGSSGTYDYATVVYWENLPPISIALVSAGLRLRFTGVPGRSYTIECATAVTGPWSILATPTAPPGGLIEYVDTNPPVSNAFYRTVQP